MTFKEAQIEAFRRIGLSEEHIQKRISFSDFILPEANEILSKDLKELLREGKTEEDVIRELVILALKNIELERSDSN